MLTALRAAQRPALSFELLGGSFRIAPSRLLPAGEHAFTWDGREPSDLRPPRRSYIVDLHVGRHRITSHFFHLR